MPSQLIWKLVRSLILKRRDGVVSVTMEYRHRITGRRKFVALPGNGRKDERDALDI
jgi:hypothetical protein